MPVLINFKICDNAQECNGIAVCPTGALSWDKKNKTVKINNEKCVSCGKCEESCMVDAIHVAKNEKEYEKIKKEIEDDSRKIEDLFVDRYGATPIGLPFLITEKEFQKEVVESNKLVAAELFEDDSIMCLLKSIPIKELFKGVDLKFRKVHIKDKEFLKKYKISTLPSLVFFKENRLLGKIEGYFDNKQKKELVGKIKKIVSRK